MHIFPRWLQPAGQSAEAIKPSIGNCSVLRACQNNYDSGQFADHPNSSFNLARPSKPAKFRLPRELGAEAVAVAAYWRENPIVPSVELLPIPKMNRQTSHVLLYKPCLPTLSQKDPSSCAALASHEMPPKLLAALRGFQELRQHRRHQGRVHSVRDAQPQQPHVRDRL